MEENASNPIDFAIKLNSANLEQLGEIRTWQNLYIGFTENHAWVKGFTEDQIDSAIVKKIPFIERFYFKRGKLFLFNQLLPSRNMPSVLWSPIQRGITLELPKYNYNYFGSDQKIEMILIPSQIEKKSEAIITDFATLEKYIFQAPAIRLNKIAWVLLEENTFLLIGEPLLPLAGKSFWRNKNSFIPTGFDFELNILSNTAQDMICDDDLNFILWHEDSTYTLIDKLMLQPLTVSSFKRTLLKRKV